MNQDHYTKKNPLTNQPYHSKDPVQTMKMI